MTEPATIYAPATAPGEAAIAVVRVSGPAAGAALRALSGRAPPPPRTATLRQLRHPESGAPIDEALVLWFAAPASYSGEDMVEYHIHGGAAVQAALLDALAACAGLAPAPPGGFTRQAVRNGRMDLLRAEAIADLIAADSPAQHAQALAQKAGGLGALYEGWRQRLTDALAHMEAGLEFADEDLPSTLDKRAQRAAQGVADEVTTHLADTRGERLRTGLTVALLGAPNVGKSSLLNRLAGREAAIVSARAGT
ncbi:MAG: 50S ribosome-binding GTPase, partial [Hyphomicrobiales bacterium]|nr:50S ribosome-binding GTPase [Hyphomicrobiales bacterium]